MMKLTNKQTKKQLRAAFRHLRCDMRPEPGVRLSDLLAARLDTAVYDDPRTSKLTRYVPPSKPSKTR